MSLLQRACQSIKRLNNIESCSIKSIQWTVDLRQRYGFVNGMTSSFAISMPYFKNVLKPFKFWWWRNRSDSLFGAQFMQTLFVQTDQFGDEVSMSVMLGMHPRLTKPQSLVTSLAWWQHSPFFKDCYKSLAKCFPVGRAHISSIRQGHVTMVPRNLLTLLTSRSTHHQANVSVSSKHNSFRCRCDSLTMNNRHTEVIVVQLPISTPQFIIQRSVDSVFFVVVPSRMSPQHLGSICVAVVIISTMNEIRMLLVFGALVQNVQLHSIGQQNHLLMCFKMPHKFRVSLW